MASESRVERPVGTRSLPWLAIALACALVSAAVVAWVDRDDTPSDDAQSVTVDPDLRIPSTGTVVGLDIVDPDSFTTGWSTVLHVEAADVEGVDRIELWQDDRVVDRVDVGGDPQIRQRVDWVPTSPGFHLLSARTVATNGRVTMSPVTWVDVAAAPVVSEGTVVTGSLTAIEVDGPRGFRSLAQAAPAMEVVVDGCDITVSDPQSDADRTVIVLSSLGASISDSVAALDSEHPVFDLVPGAGVHGVVGARVTGDAVTYTAPAVVDLPDSCQTPGWSGELDLVGGRLRVPNADLYGAYLYIERGAEAWERVPVSGTVGTRVGQDGAFDFAGLLPKVDVPVAFEAWGWGPDGLLLLGRGRYDPPADDLDGPSSVTEFPLAGPLVRWYYPHTSEVKLDTNYPKLADDLDPLLSSGSLIPDPATGELGSHSFAVDNLPLSTTHVVVQVAGLPFAGAGWNEPDLRFSCVVSPSDLVRLDLDEETCSNSIEVAPSNAFRSEFSSTQVTRYDAVIPQAFAYASDNSTDPIGDVESALTENPEAPPTTEAAWAPSRHVRVVPFVGDQWFGQTSNVVDLEVDLSPAAPDGEPAYELDVEMVTGPRAPNIQLQECWRFGGWTDPALVAKTVQAHSSGHITEDLVLGANVQAGAIVRWNELLSFFGDGPICPGCYRVDGVDHAVGSVECEFKTSFLEDPLGWVYENLAKPLVSAVKGLLNAASSSYAKLKSVTVQAAMDLTGCTSDECRLVASTALDIGLAAVGVPPSLPNFDQVMAAAKGELVNAVTDAAQAAGLPCDKLNLAAAASQQPVSCEAMAGALIDEVAQAADDAFRDVAKNVGMGFPDVMIVRPWQAGQTGAAVFDVTVRPTAYAADREGATCDAIVVTEATRNLPYDREVVANPPGIGPVELREALPPTWKELAYEYGDWTLPDLAKAGSAPGAYAPTTARFVLDSPHRKEPLPVAVVNASEKRFLSVSPYAILFYRSSLRVTILTTCAGIIQQRYRHDPASGLTAWILDEEVRIP